MRRLPANLRQKWMDRTVKFSKEDREPEFNDLFEFLNDQALAIKSSFGQELIRLQSSENRKQPKQANDVKKAKPEKPAKTLMTANTPAASTYVPPKTHINHQH